MKEKAKKRMSARKPDWLRSLLPGGIEYADTRQMLRKKKLHTVCEEARCPNLGSCWGGGTATFMVLGDICTRGCRFCAIKTAKNGMLVDSEEPMSVATSAQEMNLDYVVITSVDRDDLADGGASHFAAVIRTVREVSEGKILIEVLTSDFQGDQEAIQQIVDAKPTVFAHNIETVRRLTPSVRDPRSRYEQTLEVLRYYKERFPEAITKTSIMLGLGETEEELLETMDDLREVGVDILTLGQYLQPSTKHLRVEEYVTPERFQYFAEKGLERGFAFVPSGPLVRSSFRAGQFFRESFERSGEHFKRIESSSHSGEKKRVKTSARA